MEHLRTAFTKCVPRPFVSICLGCLGAALLAFVGGCGLLEAEDAYRDDEVLAGTERAVPFSAYLPGSLTPKFSPDGRQVVVTEFDRERFVEALYVLDVDTGTRRYLTDGRNADWSPDGQWIAFNCGVQICKIRADGTERQQLTQEGRNFFPDWSPDGQRIAFDNTNCGNQLEPPREGDCGILVMHSDGSSLQRLFSGRYPDWHPSGRTIIAWKQIASGSDVLSVFDLVENQEETILQDVVYDLSEPEYAPDGNRIVFQNEDGIWVADVDGRHPHRIVPNQYPHPDFSSNDRPPKLGVASPSWHPDGRHVVYEHFAITRYRMNETGPRVEGSVSIRLIEVK